MDSRHFDYQQLKAHDALAQRVGYRSFDDAVDQGVCLHELRAADRGTAQDWDDLFL